MRGGLILAAASWSWRDGSLQPTRCSLALSLVEAAANHTDGCEDGFDFGSPASSQEGETSSAELSEASVRS